MRDYAFERLDVWQKARGLVKVIYQHTQKFPSVEQFGLIVQMRKSAISIPSNIAEGTSRRSKKDKMRFVEIAYGSLMELLNQVIISVDLEYLTAEEYQDLRPRFEEISNKLSALRRAYSK